MRDVSIRRMLPLLFACFTTLAADTPPPAPPAHPDEAASFFGLDHLWTMHLTLTASNWAAMEPVRVEGGPGPRGPGRLERDYPEVAGTLDWEGRRWTNISVRYKGNSSFNFARESLKRSLKLDFNDLAKGQKFLGLTKLNLNNNTMDATQMQEAIAYDVCRRAGVPAARTAFVRVYLTVPTEHERLYLGLYTAVEQVDERLLEKQVGTRQGLLLKPETAQGIPYFGNTWTAYKSAYDPKSNATAAEKTRLMEFARLVNEADLETFQRDIGGYLEVEAFLRFLAVNVVLANYDSYLAIGHNYYLHLDPRSNRFRFLPWDLNHAFGKFPMTGTPADQMQGRFFPPNVSRNPLVEKLLASPARVEIYRRHVREILEQHFQPARLHAQVDAVAKLLREAIPGDLLYTPEEFDRAVSGAAGAAGANRAEPRPTRSGRPGPGGPGGRERGPSLKDWITGRAASLQAQLDSQSTGTSLAFTLDRPGGPGGRGGPPGMGPAALVGPRLHQLADPDQDRRVSRPELLALLEDGFQRWDNDQDGGLTLEEWMRWMESLLGGPRGPGREFSR